MHDWEVLIMSTSVMSTSAKMVIALQYIWFVWKQQEKSTNMGFTQQN